MAGHPNQPEWSGDEYADAADHHRTYDDWFLDALAPAPTDVVVDAGCGSGEFTARLAALASQGSVIGVEPDPSMLARAEANAAPNLEFRAGRIQDLDEVCGTEVADLVVSRAVLHWIPLDDHDACFGAVRRVLKPGGWFHAEAGGAGNVAAVEALLDDIAGGLGLGTASVVFPDPGSVLERLEQVGFHVADGNVSTVAQRRSFDRATLDGFLRTQAALAYLAGADADTRDRFLAEIDERAEELRRHDGTFDQTFVRLHILARRPGEDS
jgi:trans-aconitate methyltransferase